MSGLFSLDKVKISYGKNEIVHGVSMDIAKGEFCALLGLNGSGKTTWLFGRSEDCDFVYSAPKASRRHFQIELCDGHYYIQDLGSTNGTYVNGRRIDYKERIFSGDVITMGGVDIVFSKDMLF